MSDNKEKYLKIWQAKQADPQFNITLAIRKIGVTPTSYYHWAKRHNAELAGKPLAPKPPAVKAPPRKIEVVAEEPAVVVHIPITDLIESWKRGKDNIQVTWKWLERVMTNEQRKALEQRIGELVINTPPKKAVTTDSTVHDDNGHDIVK